MLNESEIRMIRLSVGLEDAEDILEDITNAIEQSA